MAKVKEDSEIVRVGMANEDDWHELAGPLDRKRMEFAKMVDSVFIRQCISCQEHSVEEIKLGALV